MRFGFCTSPDRAALLQAQGWDYIEVSASADLQADSPPLDLPLPALAANSLVRALKIVGPDADPDALRTYMAGVIDRAAAAGLSVLVFGSAGARNVPDDFDRTEAMRQIVAFARMSGELAAARGITVVVEPLERGESNVLNTVAEGAALVDKANTPGFRCLVDSYHFWKESDSVDALAAAMPHIAHVHVADLEGRAAPGESGSSEYRPFFRTLKEGGYDGLCSVECRPVDLETRGPAVLDFLRREWEAA